ncbi:MAG: hypothetical protein U9Q68_02600 [Euryarchaeota archaeon]|nr:hypothetical protein [Euryarchaeota archaeon]
MNLSGITQTFETINIHPDEIHEEQLSEAFRILLQLIEDLSENNEKLKAENQKLRDEISLMKGEQPKPDIKPSGKKPNVNISSEEERKPKNTSKNKKPKTKKDKIKIDRIHSKKYGKTRLQFF